ncbi:hypothetical protein DL765_011204 [Monosporascus sp. GIB2]|nr:hypothetical protein DL765_011204 [Monosporascus sp. GIB2]
MDRTEKSLPSLPAHHKKGPKTRKPAPLPLSHRSLVTSPQKPESDGQLQQLRQENEKLCRLLARLQGDQDERDRRIATLEQQNREYRENDKEHKRLITRIANTFSDTFYDYQASLSQTNKEQVSQKATGVKDVRIGYEDVISAWSDYSSS